MSRIAVIGSLFDESQVRVFASVPGGELLAVFAAWLSGGQSFRGIVDDA